MSNVDEVTLLAIDSGNRVLSFSTVASRLSIPPADVEIRLLTALAAGHVFGKIDAESQHFVIDGTPEVATHALVERADAALTYFESVLSSDVETLTKKLAQ